MMSGFDKYSIIIYNYYYTYELRIIFIIIVTVVVPCVCVCVVFCDHVHLDPKIQVRTCSLRHGKLFWMLYIIIVIFAENASFRSYCRHHLLASNATN